MMFPLEQEIINKYRKFWCSIALNHTQYYYTTEGDFRIDDWWYDDLAPVLKHPIITRAAWDEAVAWKQHAEATIAYKEATRRFSDQLDHQEIGCWELGHELELRK